MATEPTTVLPRDEFSVRLRELSDNPGAVKSSSRVDIADTYGNAVTWTIDTFRIEGSETVFVQRMSAEGSLRLVLPPAVTSVLSRQHDRATGVNRRRGARQAVETKRAKGVPVGNPEALRFARKMAKTQVKVDRRRK